MTKVSLFLPCLADLYYPDIGRATIRVLRQAGLSVDYPEDQTCCGQWAFNMGQPEAARRLAEHFIRVFEAAPAVVAPSGSCVLTVRNHYPELFRDDQDWLSRAQAVGAKTYEFTDFLVNIIHRTELGAVCQARATLHDSCHPLRGLNLKNEPRLLLAQVSGLDLIEMEDPEACCGFGGAFMAKFAPLSKAMVDQKIDQAEKTGADLLVMTEPGCLLNVDSALKARNSKLKAVHIAQILAGKGGEIHV
jgi:L-lactate dehydrogenase complex protein LldE